ncbi:MAG: sporulation protein [Defluviitaleaceae bacterium]|nr:sporulation protein [Defluviitaleaceae bacterium]
MSEIKKDLNTNLETLFNNMDNFVTSKTVVGDPIYLGDLIILPLVDVSFGVGAVSRKKEEKEKVSGGAEGGGLGAKVMPSAVIVINQKTSDVQLVNVKNQDALGKVIDMIPGIFSKISDNINNKKQSKEEKENEIMKAILENNKDIKEEI